MIKTLLHFDSIDGEMNYDTILKKIIAIIQR